MAKRQIKDAQVNGESVYFKGHAQATYMSSGITVEDAINNIGTNIDLTNYATKTEIPTKVSQLENDANYITASDLNAKQDTLISGTNIKTINGESILGSGNITISGSSSSGGSGAYAEVNHGTNDATFVLTPNTFHVWDEVTSLDLSFADEQAGVANEYLFQFTSGAPATTLTLPDGLKWANNAAPNIAENMIYQISVLKGLASVLEFSNAAALIENKATLTNTKDGEVTFQYPVASTITVSVRGDVTNKLIFNEGDQSKSVGESVIGGYTILSISPNEDNTYIYVF